MRTVIFSTVLFALIFQFSAVSADSMDNLIETLQSGSYTIRYENITPLSRRTSMKERAYVFDGKMFSEDSYMMHNIVSGIIASDGDNRYTETFATQTSGLIYASCELKRGAEAFYFTRLEENGKVKYIGKVEGKNHQEKDEKGKVSAIKARRNLTNGNSVSFGDSEDVIRVMSAIIPNSGKAENALVYEKVKTGTLANGLEYFDFKVSNLPEGVIFDAIRYYFDNGTLVKIAAGQYFNIDGRLDGARTIIKIIDFQPSADSKIFQLPDGLKDVTKREGE